MFLKKLKMLQDEKICIPFQSHRSFGGEFILEKYMRKK